MKPPAKAYLTKAGFAKTVWGKRIIAAEKRKYFHEIDCDRAANWVTCACAKLSFHLPRLPDGSPKNWTLRSLGKDFYRMVAANDPRRAAETLVAIEDRAQELLRERKS